MALAEMERSLCEDEAGRLDHLNAVASEALKAGELAKARAYAPELLEQADLTQRGTPFSTGIRSWVWSAGPRGTSSTRVGEQLLALVRPETDLVESSATHSTCR
jgi:hypothetical protein